MSEITEELLDSIHAAQACLKDLRELAFQMLLECEKRPGKQGFDPGHFEDLIRDVLDAGEIELARKIRDYCDDDALSDPDSIQFLFDLLENPERFAPLEQGCRKSLAWNKDAEMVAAD